MGIWHLQPKDSKIRCTFVTIVCVDVLLAEVYGIRCIDEKIFYGEEFILLPLIFFLNY